MWSLRCGWRPSSWEMEDVAARVVEWCNQVGGLYPELSEWRFTADSKRAALATPVVTEHELVRNLVADGGLASIWAPRGDLSVHLDADDYVRFPPERRGIHNEDRDAREAQEVRPGVP